MSSNITEQTSLQQTHNIQNRRKITYGRKPHSSNDSRSIYKGKFEGSIDCAVRKIEISDSDRSLIDHIDLESLPKKPQREVKNNEEILNLTQTNIVRYYYYEFESIDNKLYLLLALEWCDCNLGYFIDPETRKEFPELSNTETMFQLTSGLQFLHSRNIVHRNLKPSNILIKREGGKLLFKLSDLGSAKRQSPTTGDESKQQSPTTGDESKQQSPTTGDESPSTEYATEGWTPPEIFGQNIVYLESDIFTLGLIFYFIATNGKYAFKSQDNKKGGERDLSDITDNITLRCLLERMVNTSPEERPLTEEIISHPALWRSEHTLKFIVKTSDVLDKAKRKGKKIEEIKKGSKAVIDIEWKTKLTKEVNDYLFPSSHTKGKPNYKPRSLASLIRAIRNNKSNFDRLEDNVTAEFGSYPDGYLSYWTTKFPQLLMHTYNAMKAYKDEHENSLKKFYP